MPTYWFDATNSNAHPEDATELYDHPDADALADADKVRPVSRETANDGVESDAAAIDAGVCPWCPEDDQYEGDHVGRHASRAHPEEWQAYKADR